MAPNFDTQQLFEKIQNSQIFVESLRNAITAVWSARQTFEQLQNNLSNEEKQLYIEFEDWLNHVSVMDPTQNIGEL